MHHYVEPYQKTVNQFVEELSLLSAYVFTNCFHCFDVIVLDNIIFSCLYNVYYSM